MIQYYKEDLFTTTAPIIVHGCNAKGVMGSGIAKLIKEKYPKAFEDYQKFCSCRYQEELIGRIIPSVQPNGTIIINAITQMNYGTDGRKYVSYDAVDQCLDRVASDLMFKDLLGRYKKERTTIAMPKIGAGLGGGEWTVIEAIIAHRLRDHDVLVYHLE